MDEIGVRTSISANNATETTRTGPGNNQRLANRRLALFEGLARLQVQGVERYSADLTLATLTFYMPDGTPNVVASDLFVDAAHAFCADSMASLLRLLRVRAFRYPDFVLQLGAAGCVGYFVQLDSLQAVFYGYSGDGCDGYLSPRMPPD